MFKQFSIQGIITAAIILLLVCLTQAHAKGFKEGWVQEGVSSYYAKRFSGRLTASGERYKHQALTAAHRSLPFGTKIQVTDKDTGKSVVVKVNDRGPFHGNRILDLSGGAAKRLGITQQGLCDIEIKVLSVPPQTKKATKKPSKVFTHRADLLEGFIASNFDTTKL